LRPSNVRGGIAVGTLYGIDHELLARAKVGIDVFPHDGAVLLLDDSGLNRVKPANARSRS
jgi:hypothetical protein